MQRFLTWLFGILAIIFLGLLIVGSCLAYMPDGQNHWPSWAPNKVLTLGLLLFGFASCFVLWAFAVAASGAPGAIEENPGNGGQ